MILTYVESKISTQIVSYKQKEKDKTVEHIEGVNPKKQ